MTEPTEDIRVARWREETQADLVRTLRRKLRGMPADLPPAWQNELTLLAILDGCVNLLNLLVRADVPIEAITNLVGLIPKLLESKLKARQQ